MKIILVILFGLPIVLLSFSEQENVGKLVFEANCQSCHIPNKSTITAPSFQNIRNDYGLKWTLNFIKDSRKLMERKDINALYSYYLFGKSKHIIYPALESSAIIKILDYVDSFPVDTAQYKHRLVSYQEKKKFVQYQLRVDTVPESNQNVFYETIDYDADDTVKVNTNKKRTSTRRGTSKQ